MIAPPAAAYLLTDRLHRMIVYSALLAAMSALSGYWVAHWLDTSIAGSMATMSGVIFGVVFLVAPSRGILSQVNRRLHQRLDFAQTMLAIHLANHEGTKREAEESGWDTLHEHLRWEREFLERVVRRARKQQLIALDNNYVSLTDSGRKLARQALTR
jgi:manganese/zinc/iron transport system permease protein